MFLLLLITCTSICIVIGKPCNTTVDQTACQLYDFMLDGYYKNIRPCFGCSSPLNINITFHLTSLNDLDEVASEMITIGYISVKWMDSRLTWNPADYGGIVTMLFPFESVWTPKLLVGNPSRKITDLNGELTVVRLFYNGLAVWSPGDIFRTRCYADIYLYPFDEQTCYISFVPWGYAANEITVSDPPNTNPAPFYKDNGEWMLDRMRTNSYFGNSMSVVEFYFTFKRRPQFFIVNVLLPIVLLCFLNCLVFKIPVSSGERISYAITVLLSFAVFMTLVGDNIPKTSDPMSLLSYYLVSVFAMSTFISVCTIFNMRIYHRDQKIPVTPRYKALVRLVNHRFRSSSKIAPNKTIQVIGVSEMSNIVKGKESKSTMEDSIENIMLEDDKKCRDEADITWADVSDSIDTVFMFSFILSFVLSSAAHLLVIYFAS